VTPLLLVKYHCRKDTKVRSGRRTPTRATGNSTPSTFPHRRLRFLEVPMERLLTLHVERLPESPAGIREVDMVYTMIYTRVVR